MGHPRTKGIRLRPSRPGTDLRHILSWPGWTRTTTAGSKDRCPAIRRRAIVPSCHQARASTPTASPKTRWNRSREDPTPCAAPSARIREGAVRTPADSKPGGILGCRIPRTRRDRQDDRVVRRWESTGSTRSGSAAAIRRSPPPAERSPLRAARTRWSTAPKAGAWVVIVGWFRPPCFRLRERGAGRRGPDGTGRAPAYWDRQPSGRRPGRARCPSGHASPAVDGDLPRVAPRPDPAVETRQPAHVGLGGDRQRTGHDREAELLGRNLEQGSR